MIASHKCIKMIGHPFCKFLGINSILKNTHTMLKLKLLPLSKMIMKMFVTTPSKSKPLLNKAGIMNTLIKFFNTLINLTLIIILPTTTVINLVRTNIIIKPPSNHILLLHVHIIIVPLLVGQMLSSFS